MMQQYPEPCGSPCVQCNARGQIEQLQWRDSTGAVLGRAVYEYDSGGRIRRKRLYEAANVLYCEQQWYLDTLCRTTYYENGRPLREEMRRV